MVENDNQHHDGDNHRDRDPVNAHRIHQLVVHDVDILREPIRDAPQRRRVEEGHRRPQHPRHRILQHRPAGVRAAGRQDRRVRVHQDGLRAAEPRVDADVLTRAEVELVGRPVRQPQAGDDVGAVGQRQGQEDQEDVDEGAGGRDVCLPDVPAHGVHRSLLLLHQRAALFGRCRFGL